MSLLETSICGIRLRNPVIAASGTFAYGVEFAEQVDLNALGGLVVKGTRVFTPARTNSSTISR